MDDKSALLTELVSEIAGTYYGALIIRKDERPIAVILNYGEWLELRAKAGMLT